MRWCKRLWILCFMLCCGLSGAAHAFDEVSQASLPPEARATIQLIKQGGPWPYARDGVSFMNRERRLPQMPRGYYREFTVKTPGLSHRGARRIVAGGEPPVVFYYSDDHYRSFQKVRD